MSIHSRSSQINSTLAYVFLQWTTRDISLMFSSRSCRQLKKCNLFAAIFKLRVRHTPLTTNTQRPTHTLDLTDKDKLKPELKHRHTKTMGTHPWLSSSVTFIWKRSEINLHRATHHTEAFIDSAWIVATIDRKPKGFARLCADSMCVTS